MSVLGTHDGHILMFNVPSNGRNIYLRETVKGNTVKVFFVICRFGAADDAFFGQIINHSSHVMRPLFYVNICPTSTICAADITISYSLIKPTF